MPDEQPSDDIFSAWSRALDADPNTQRSGMPATSAAAPAPAPAPPPQPAPAPSQGAPSGSSIASTAASLVGNNSATIAPFLQKNGQSLNPLQANWCAAFVNGVLAANGEPGTTGPGKNVATSFMNWGEPASQPQPGDVLVQPRGHPAGGIGGHVGIAAGPIAQGSGQTYYLMQSGNYAGHVAYSWEPAGSVVVRRAPSSSQSSPAPDSSQSQAQY